MPESGATWHGDVEDVRVGVLSQFEFSVTNGIVDAAQVQIRRLVPADAALYRDIRLEGLRCDPEAFGSTFEAENARPLAFFSDRIAGSATFGAFHGSELVGIAGLVIREGQKEAHKGLLVGMYVRPSARKAGVGRRLVETIVEIARHRVELIQLAVVSDNEPARRLYVRLGFVEYGIEKKALKQDGRYYDEVLMARDLKPD
ncbi:MAG TPA: GNAT family N-acetyltransferase [Terriglobales bacterium]|nr:GNAT family N-acetyltransferase [Terriglobales bacterium]